MTNPLAGEALIARDAAVFFHQSGSSPVRHAAKAVGGIWIENDRGQRLIDLHGNTVHHIGHAHPRLIAALKAQLDDLPFCPRRFTNEPAVALAENLASRWTGRGRARVLFATGGSDAIEIALRLARVTTGRSETISLEGSYHGHGFGALGLSSARLDPRLGAQMPGRHHVMPYWGVAEGGAERMASEIEAIFKASKAGVAALIAEPIRSNCHVPPAWLWPAVRELCDRHGALLIFDEIPGGLGKTGRFFAHQHFEVEPDAVVLGKSLGGGVVPIAAVIGDERLNVAPELDLGHYTHEKNPVTTRAALTTLAIIDDEGLVAQAARLGEYARDRMAKLAEAHGCFGQARGIGLLLAWELAKGSDMAARAAAIADRAVAEGVSTLPKGGDAIAFSAPLVIREEEIDLALEGIMRAAIATAA